MRIVFTPWGSFGDLHPYLGVALEMKRRGHDVLIATSELYRPKVEGEGLRFRGVRPDMSEYLEHPERMARVMARLRGPEYLFRQVLMPGLHDMFADLVDAAKECDLLVSHAAMCAAPLVAEKLSLPWVSVALQPVVFWSTHDASVFPLVGDWLRLFPSLAAGFNRLVRLETARWLAPVFELRRELGLPVDRHPLFEAQFSRFGTLAWFSPAFAGPQPDWPPNTIVTGFAFYDKLDPSSSGLSPDIEQFLAAGEPPVVFTLGSSAAYVPSEFYEVSAAVVQRLNIRGILLAGMDFKKRIPIRSGSRLLIAEYAEYSKLFPRSAAIVHSGGIGTTAQVLRAGKPMIVMPFSHDQPDNAARVTRLGTGLTIRRGSYRVNRVERELKRLLGDHEMARRADAIGRAIRTEDGIATASDRLEQIVGNTRSKSAITA
jgi:UDP:flavonoid glycosyltransferase YjiC (YdhE family)